MLYTKLKSIYDQNGVLASEYPLDEYFLLLNNFIMKEVSLGAEFLSPYRFSLFYSKSPKDAIRFFLGLSESNEIVQQHYKYECTECGKINIIKDEDDLFNFICKQCGTPDQLSKPEYLNEVKLLFKINDELLESIEENLKDNPLFNEPLPAVLEGGIDEDTSLKTAGELVYKDGKAIGKKAEEKFNRYRAILGD